MFCLAEVHTAKDIDTDSDDEDGDEAIENDDEENDDDRSADARSPVVLPQPSSTNQGKRSMICLLFYY